MSVNINNNTVSMNVADTLAPLLRLIDPEELAKYDCLTPTGLDFLAIIGMVLKKIHSQLVHLARIKFRPLHFLLTLYHVYIM